MQDMDRLQVQVLRDISRSLKELVREVKRMGVSRNTFNFASSEAEEPELIIHKAVGPEEAFPRWMAHPACWASSTDYDPLNLTVSSNIDVVNCSNCKSLYT